jgi:CheY-like chemotaxis protein
MSETSPIIHVVDDDASFRSAIGELLGPCGYKVWLHETARKLLESSLSEGPACILLDLQMAGLNGLQLQDRLSELGCRLPIVFISAYGDIPTTHSGKPLSQDRTAGMCPCTSVLSNAPGCIASTKDKRSPSRCYLIAGPANRRRTICTVSDRQCR